MKTDWRLWVTVAVWIIAGSVWMWNAKHLGDWADLVGVGVFVLVVLVSLVLDGIETPTERRDRLAREARWRQYDIERLALKFETDAAKQDGRGLPWAG